MSSNVVELVPEQKPIAETPPRERLGILVARYRTAATKTVEETAANLGVSEHALAEVERHQGTLSAGQLQAMAAFLSVRYEPLLDAARDWHRAVWAADKAPGVQLESMTTAIRSLAGAREAENELELELIKCSDELVFLSNVMREASIKAEVVAVRTRELLAMRGVEVPGVEPIDGQAEVECEGPRHKGNPHKLIRGRDLVIVYKSDGDEPPHYFCSQKCGLQWAAE
jgi:transcriptional regulator with XRE-family HTH domain